ncbi:protoporphyrinogen/coproporphyrinogen oxidase [Geomesophilobacter sediminis]|uniref:FAD-dependent oxidoreductase n=1 Tax=Geomesophilobacter sediminis TaxID=2798584 RepID=A0A8J7J839_9BACT|nr:FAD-dependent oxidoreductase [Geomesophilobacter sediminis]MBJ6725666.1 FAD-dependent oxidoreductase [Geomesophilobacter sediminis]
MKNYDVVVIGAGISGLSLARYAREAGLEALVLERAERSGGCFHSHRFADGFWLELGAHTCYNSYGGLIRIMESLGMMGEIVGREKVSFKMLVGDQICSITSQLSFLELFTSAWRLFSLKKEGESVASYYSRIVGAKNFENVFAPAFNAVISQRANDFPADMLFNKRPRRKDVIKSYTLKDGLSSITDRIAAGLEVVTGAEITRVAKNGDGYAIELADGRGFEAKRLVLATPPPDAARLCAEVAPDAAAVLQGIKVEEIETVGVAVRKELLQVPPMAGLIAIDDSFYSAVSRDTLLDPGYRGFSFHFKSGRLGHEEKLLRIAQVLQVKRDALQQNVARDSRLPSPVVGHHQLIAKLDRALAGQNLFVTGNYFAGMAIEDCIVRSGKEFQRLSQKI